MKQKHGRLALILWLVLVLSGPAWAEPTGGIRIDWHAVASGGGPARSADYAIHGTVGQLTAEGIGNVSHRLATGFWLADLRAPAGHGLSLPLLLSGFAE